MAWLFVGAGGVKTVYLPVFVGRGNEDVEEKKEKRRRE